MSDSSTWENEPQIQARSPYARPGPIPDIRLAGLIEEHTPSLIPRDGSSSTTSSASVTRTSCGPKDTTGPCERSTSSRDNTTLPITLGVIIPLAAAFIVMIFLHRRNLKKQRREDDEDRHKSLDFGLGPRAKRASKAKKGGKGHAPEMAMSDARDEIRRGRALSMDMGVSNPYLLPPGLQHSRESLHSLSRSFNTGDDKYGRTNFIPDDGSIRSPSSLRRGADDDSSFTGSSRPRFDYESSRTLVQTSTKSGPPTRKASLTSTKEPVPDTGITRKPIAPPKENLLAPTTVDSRESFLSTTSNNATAAFRKSNDYLGAFIRGGGLGISTEEKTSKKETKIIVSEMPPSPPKEEIQPPVVPLIKQNEIPKPVGLPSNPRPKEPQLPQLNFTDFDTKKSSSPEISVTEPKAAVQQQQSEPPSRQGSQHYSQHNSEYYSRENSYYGQQRESQGQNQTEPYYNQNQYDQQQFDQHYDQNGVPQIYTEEYDDGEDYYDPAEEYSDYGAYQEDYGYDPRRTTWGMRPLPPDDPSENPEQRANRIRSFYKEYFDAPNGAYQGGYYDGSEAYDDYYYQDQRYASRGHSSTGGRYRGHTYSNGSYMPGPRAYSSASGRYGHPYGRSGPRKPQKPMAPPKALNILPTPSKLKDDTFLLEQAVDFAPPTKAFLQRAGTPDSLRGGQRPYSPTVRAHIPLTSSFDDLSAMPSPHMLRRSGTFTALDFAPPAPKYRGQDGTVSETGSIRSNRSGISAMHVHNIRAGAYRLSRIPKEVAGTKAELNTSLRPRWDMNR